MITKGEAKAWKKFLALREQNPHIPPPNLIGVGAARCGTTTMYHMLEQSDAIYMSPAKELAYFSHKFEIWSRKEYLLFFHGCGDAQYRGEISPHYLHSPDAVLRISRAAMGAKIIIQLRNPVKRTISHYRHHFPHHKIVDADKYFVAAIQGYHRGRTDLKFSHPTSNLAQSFYYDGVSRYIEAFGKENVFVLFMDDMKADPIATAAQLSEWLGVEVPPRENIVGKSRDVEGGSPVSQGALDVLTELFAEDFAKTCALVGRDPSEFTI